MKVVINACYGGFSVSLEAARHMAAAGSKQAAVEVAKYEKTLRDFAKYKATGKLSVGEHKHIARFWDINIRYGTKPDFHGYGYTEGFDGGYARNDPLLVAAVEALGDKASGDCANLKVVEIPDGTDYEISEYDGNEHIAEKHRTWG